MGSRTVCTRGMRITAKVLSDYMTLHTLWLNTKSSPSFISLRLEKRKPSILDTLDNTNLTIIGVTCGLVVILLIISVIIQIKQPRKKYIIRR